MFAAAIHLHPSQMLLGKAGAYQSGVVQSSLTFGGKVETYQSGASYGPSL